MPRVDARTRLEQLETRERSAIERCVTFLERLAAVPNAVLEQPEREAHVELEALGEQIEALHHQLARPARKPRKKKGRPSAPSPQLV